MINIKVQIPKIDEILSDTKIDRLLIELAKRVRTRMIQATPVDTTLAKKSYTQPGFESVDSEFPVSRKSRGIAFGNVAPYAHVLERGSIKGKKPWPRAASKTVEVDGVIRSSQAPYGIFEGADIEKVVERELPKIMEKLLSD